MPKLTSNGIEIEYEDYGRKGDPVMLLVGGWSVQLTFWPKPFVEAIVDAGYRVIVFDNRDAGHSQKMRFPPTSPFAAHVVAARLFKSRRLTAYTLEDMADDTIGILDALEIETAHLLGLSMGGMISQIVAAKHPQRIKSLTILMSTTNRLTLPSPSLSLGYKVFVRRPARRMAQQRARTLNLWKAIRTQDGGYDESDFAAGINATIDRSYAPAGRRRQLEAIFATGDLRRWTRKIQSPTLVLHGSADVLARPYGGVDIASNIPHSKFELITGMGHDLPPNLIGKVSGKIIKHLKAAEADPFAHLRKREAA